MGANVSINSNQLSYPRNPIVATENRFIFQQPIYLSLRERIASWSGDDFAITDLNGTPFFKCSGKVFSMRQKKILYDVYMNPIYNIKHELLSMRGRYKFMYGGQGDRVIASVDPINAFSSHYSINFYNLATGRNDYLELACDFMGSKCGIFHGKAKEGAPMICRINKQYDAKNYFYDKQNYVVEISPNVDAALMIGLGIIFDEIKNDNND